MPPTPSPPPPPDDDFDKAWLKSTKPITVASDSAIIASELWFKSKPLEPDFVNRVAQIQLCTDSRDQGSADDRSKGSWTWFEIVVLHDANTDMPKRTKDGREMAWRSHSNQLGHYSQTRNFGLIFDRRSHLLACLEAGDVLAVRACSRFPGWCNFADKGYITARILSEGKKPIIYNIVIHLFMYRLSTRLVYTAAVDPIFKSGADLLP